MQVGGEIFSGRSKPSDKGGGGGGGGRPAPEIRGAQFGLKIRRGLLP